MIPRMVADNLGLTSGLSAALSQPGGGPPLLPEGAFTLLDIVGHDVALAGDFGSPQLTDSGTHTPAEPPSPARQS